MLKRLVDNAEIKGTDDEPEPWKKVRSVVVKISGNSDDSDSDSESTTSINTSINICEICGMVFNKDSNLRRHRPTIHGDNKKLFQCPYCDYQGSRRDNTNRHQKRCHAGLDFASLIVLDDDNAQPKQPVSKTIHNPTPSMHKLNSTLTLNTDVQFRVRPGNPSNSPSNTSRGITKTVANSSLNPVNSNFTLSPAFWETVNPREPPPPCVYKLLEPMRSPAPTANLKHSVPWCATLPINQSTRHGDQSADHCRKYVDMPTLDYTTEATTTALHKNHNDLSSTTTTVGKESDATTQFLPKEPEKEQMTPPSESDEAVNLVIRTPVKDQLVEPIVPPLEPNSNIPTLQNLLRDDQFKTQLNRFVDQKMTYVLGKLNTLIASFNSSDIFSEEQKTQIENFR